MFHAAGINNSKRFWNPIRSFRRKESKKGGESAQAESEPCEETELSSRVMQWLQDSKPPNQRTRNYDPILEDTCENVPECDSDIKHSRDAPTGCILYHPDFADWSSIQESDFQTSSPSSSGDSPFKVLDDATASFSNLLRVPFALQ
jgi:hypothetical protein